MSGKALQSVSPVNHMLNDHDSGSLRASTERIEKTPRSWKTTICFENNLEAF